jgi:RecA-family ATPase
MHILVIFIMFVPQFVGSSAGDSATQSSVPGDSFAVVINNVIRGLEVDPTQKELCAEASQAEERSPVAAHENVTTAIAQQDIIKQPATYVRKAKKQKQVCV